ncbi:MULTISPECIES: hypothetical protein [Cysteiniphilum]|uniref:DotD/TraH family lipoprotein n=1 Tax=Cysteiniphilum litorale TaxID=2056700 RepID=A0A8J2Z378_9GAMM|nr:MULTISPECIES: hypothetical protein [Cysteiniphilum]GGF91582.1 hypothetical protein GCM10010995_06010 [Cysteiniphilum litorale]
MKQIYSKLGLACLIIFGLSGCASFRGEQNSSPPEFKAKNEPLSLLLEYSKQAAESQKEYANISSAEVAQNTTYTEWKRQQFNLTAVPVGFDKIIQFDGVQTYSVYALIKKIALLAGYKYVFLNRADLPVLAVVSTGKEGVSLKDLINQINSYVGDAVTISIDGDTKQIFVKYKNNLNNVNTHKQDREESDEKKS